MCVDSIISPTKTKKLCIRKHKTEQECIPVGCVPPSAVAVGGVCLSACWDPHLGVGLETNPPRCGPGDPPPQGQTPQLGPGDLQGMLGYHHPPWRPATRHAGIPSPPANRITDTCKNITLPKLRCGR